MKSELHKSKNLTKEPKYIAILDAAMAILDQEGLEGLSINKVARKAKIAKGTVYIYFESKEEIIGVLTIQARKTLLEYFKKYCEKEIEPIEKLKAIFWANYNFFHECHTYHQLVSFYEQNTGLTETKELATASYAITVYVSSIVDHAKEKGIIRQDIDTGIQTYIFWGSIVGVLQIIETKGDHLHLYFGKSKEEFYTYFIESSIKSILV